MEGRPNTVPTAAPFIVGLSRSGTTLLRLMLDSHPDVAIPPETHFIPDVAKACQSAPDPRAAFVPALTSAWRWPDFHLESDLLAARIAELEPFDVGGGLRIFYGLYADRHGKRRWGDKTNYLSNLTLVQALLPEAHFVHIVRDGRDVAVSIKDLWWGPSSAGEAATYWDSGIRRARDQVPHLLHYVEVRYEDLVLDTEQQLRKICEFIQLPWHPSMLDYHRNAENRLGELASVTDPKTQRVITGEERRGIHAYVKRPPDASRLARWKSEMTASERARFEAIAGPLLRELSYD
jgi:hypothetical protein